MSFFRFVDENSIKVEMILEDSLALIPSLSVKIQIIDGKFYYR